MQLFAHQTLLALELGLLRMASSAKEGGCRLDICRCWIAFQQSTNILATQCYIYYHETELNLVAALLLGRLTKNVDPSGVLSV